MTDPTIVSISYSKVTSVLADVLSDASSISSVLATATTTIPPLEATLSLKQATASYYSYLEVLATATATEVLGSAAPEAATASEALDELWKSYAYYEGHYPSVPGNAIFLALFIILAIVHLVFGSMTKQWWFLVSWIIGCLMEAVGYLGRIMSHYDMLSSNPFLIQLICLTIAPSFMLAGIYYLLAQLTVIMGSSFSRLKPMQYSTLFICLDFIAIVIQAVGGGTAAGADAGSDDEENGRNIMVAGLAFQVFSVTVFQCFWYDFLYACFKEKKYNNGDGFNPDYLYIREKKVFRYLLPAVSLSVLFVYIRCIYRVIELVDGFNGRLAVNESYFLVLEALMVSIACLILTFIYPGWVYGRKTQIVVKKRLPWTKKSQVTEEKAYNLKDDSYDQAARSIT